MADCIKERHEVKVRKPHICQGCGKHIEIGETATTATYANGGDIWTFYECPDCADHVCKVCTTCNDQDICIGLDYHVGLVKECIREMGSILWK